MAKPGRPKIENRINTYTIYVRKDTIKAIESMAVKAGLTRSKMARKILEEGTQ